VYLIPLSRGLLKHKESLYFEGGFLLIKQNVSTPSAKNKKCALERKAENNVEYLRDTWVCWVA